MESVFPSSFLLNSIPIIRQNRLLSSDVYGSQQQLLCSCLFHLTIYFLCVGLLSSRYAREHQIRLGADCYRRDKIDQIFSSICSGVPEHIKQTLTKNSMPKVLTVDVGFSSIFAALCVDFQIVFTKQKIFRSHLIFSSYQHLCLTRHTTRKFYDQNFHLQENYINFTNYLPHLPKFSFSLTCFILSRGGLLPVQIICMIMLICTE